MPAVRSSPLSLLDRLSYRYPLPLVDAIVEHERGVRLVAIKAVTVSEEFFQGHFPGLPLMPGVIMIESLTQAAAILLFDREAEPPASRAFLRGVDDAKFRRQVVPGDRVRLEVTFVRERAGLARIRGVAYIEDQVVAEAQLLLGVVRDAVTIDPTATVAPGAEIGAGTVVGPNATVGAQVRIGRNCRIGASSVIEGRTEIGDGYRDLPVRVDWPHPAGSEVPRRGHAARHRPAATSSASS